MRKQFVSSCFAFLAVLAVFIGCASSRISMQDDTVRPGVGYGKVELGMNQDEVVALLGQPHLKLSSTAYQYHDGFAILFDREFRVTCVMFGGWCEGDKPLVDRFRGRTPEGIGMGSSLAAVVKAYGAPEKTKRFEEAPDFLIAGYPKLGVRFAFRRDRLVHITIAKCNSKML
ncbi:hypothetical protein QQ054_16005 [Oscillatoria amoena NRMC-F 0135]|nr:hypothetical protein [Oscillatoria laete-virens]MDL5047520.1 hypothetical protein [Oscillatoria amoena NRMC-F 0135]MDL5054655.1 hypothetical protein [Oscillatoria laete-virens NRMC-F 0139]